jgi:hypothetical protein
LQGEFGLFRHRRRSCDAGKDPADHGEELECDHDDHQDADFPEAERYAEWLLAW